MQNAESKKKYIRECPFCGGEAELFQHYPYMRRSVVSSVCCKSCRANSGTWGRKDKAIEAWNNRAYEAELRANVIDEFARLIIELNNEFPTVEDDWGEIRPMRIEEMCEKIASQMKGEKEQREFNQKECDWRYKVSCIADANCADECDMDCPYKKNEKTLVKGEKE